MNKPCKHGHFDGAMHIPCYQCRAEHWEEIAESRAVDKADALQRIAYLEGELSKLLTRKAKTENELFVLAATALVRIEESYFAGNKITAADVQKVLWPYLERYNSEPDAAQSNPQHYIINGMSYVACDCANTAECPRGATRTGDAQSSRCLSRTTPMSQDELEAVTAKSSARSETEPTRQPVGGEAGEVAKRLREISGKHFKDHVALWHHSINGAAALIEAQAKRVALLDWIEQSARENKDHAVIVTFVREGEWSYLHGDPTKELESERDELRDTLLRHGFVPCDIPACNCGSWHPRFGLTERMQEVKDLLSEADHPLSNENGHLVKAALSALIAERDALKAQIEAPCEEIEKLQFIACEPPQMVVPADYARDLYRKWQDAQRNSKQFERDWLEACDKQSAAEQRAAELEAERARLREDAERYRWLRERINYCDEERSTSPVHHAPDALTWNVRCWKHDSNDFVSTTLDKAIDAARREKP